MGEALGWGAIATSRFWSLPGPWSRYRVGAVV
jgi:hypothetical protein